MHREKRGTTRSRSMMTFTKYINAPGEEGYHKV
jgi:hypothetical protein